MTDLKDSVVVITGASSGIGRAAALAFAREGARVVAAARNAEAIQQVAEQCNAAGGRGLAVQTDVTDEQQVQRLAEQAASTFGRIDVWFNNAAVTMFGRFEECPPDAFRRVIETNLFGYVYGARAALSRFREQGHGVLINNASIVGVIGQPYTSAYVSTKWAIRGFSECLRMELSLDAADDIRVCTLLPGSIDTPLFQHGANYTGREPKPMSPIYDPEQVAAAAVDIARSPRREVYIGRFPRMVSIQHTIAPGIAERIIAGQVEKDHFQDRPAEQTPGNLFEPMPQWASVTGDWKAPSPPSSRKTPMLLGGIAALAAAGLFMPRRRKSRGRRAFEPVTRPIQRLAHVGRNGRGDMKQPLAMAGRLLGRD